MPNKIDVNANTHERHRRNWQRLARGAALFTITVNDPITNTSGIGLSLSTTGGLQTSGGSLGIKLATNPGLSLSASGLTIALDPTNPGLTLGASGMRVLLNGSTLTLGASGLSINAGGVGLTQLGALTTKGDVLTHSGAAHVRLGVGSDGDVLTADSTAPNGIKWAASSGGSASPLTTKGDLWAYSTADDRLPVGTDGQILSSNSGEATGLEWIDPTLIEDGVVIGETPSGTIDGSNDTFTTASTPAADTVAVYLSGSRLTETTDYTVSGDTITFEAGSIPQGGDILRVDYVIDGATGGGGGGGGGSLPTQTGHSGEYLTTDGTNASWAAIPTGISLVYVNAAASSAIGASSSAENDFNKTYTFPADDFVAGDVYRVRVTTSGNNGTSGQTHTLRVYIGSSVIFVPVNALTASGTGTFYSTAEVMFTVRTTGGSGTIDSVGSWGFTKSGSSPAPQTGGAVAASVDTTTTNVAKVSYQFSGTSASSNVTLRVFSIEKLGAGS